MAKDTSEGGNKATFTHERMPVEFDNLNQTPVKQKDETAAWHDAARVVANVDQEELEEILAHMQVPRKVLASLEADQVWSLPLKGCNYEDHRVILWVSTRKVFEMDEATLYNFGIARAAGNEKYSLTFSFKGIPADDQHAALEKARLEAVTGQLFALSIRSNAPQGDLGLGGGESTDEEQEQQEESPA